MKKVSFSAPFNIIGIVLAVGILAYTGYGYWQLSKENTSLKSNVAELNETLASTSTALEEAQSENKALSQSLEIEQGKNTTFEARINEISTLVGVLDKLSKTDPELLKKYSRVYFLSENYAPAQLANIDSQYLYEKNRPQLFHTGA